MSATILDKVVDLGGDRGGLSLHYREAGEGRTIVFLHGMGGAPPSGASFVGMLAERHRVLLPSRPGFDETPAGHCTSLLDVVETMAQFVKRVADGKVNLVAQSAGGAVGAWLAVLHPDLVETLILSAPAAFAGHRGPPPSHSGGASHSGGGAARLSMEEIERRLYGAQPVWSAPPSDDERQRIARNAATNMGRFTAPEGNSDLLARLSEIKAPTLLIGATADEMIPESALRPFQENIRRCIRILIHGAAHEMPISAAHSWVKLVADFIDRGEYFLVNNG